MWVLLSVQVVQTVCMLGALCTRAPREGGGVRTDDSCWSEGEDVGLCMAANS